MDRPEDDFDDAAGACLIGVIHQHVDLAKPARLYPAIYIALVLYTVYSLVIYVLSVRRIHCCRKGFCIGSDLSLCTYPFHCPTPAAE